MNFLLNPFISFAYAASTTVSTGGGVAASGSIGSWVQNFYNIALAIGGILAFGGIIYGGVRYSIGKGNPSSESEGRSWITNALLGLLLLGSAWIILYTVNPQIITLKIQGLVQLQPPANISNQPVSACVGENGNYICSGSTSYVLGCSARPIIQVEPSVCDERAPWSTTNPPQNTSQADCVDHCYAPMQCSKIATGSDYYTCNLPSGVSANSTSGTECPQGSGKFCKLPQICQTTQLVDTQVQQCVSPQPAPQNPDKCNGSNVECLPPKICVEHDAISKGWQTCENPS